MRLKSRTDYGMMSSYLFIQSLLFAPIFTSSFHLPPYPFSSFVPSPPFPSTFLPFLCLPILPFPFPRSIP